MPTSYHQSEFRLDLPSSARLEAEFLNCFRNKLNAQEAAKVIDKMDDIRDQFDPVLESKDTGLEYIDSHIESHCYDIPRSKWKLLFAVNLRMREIIALRIYLGSAPKEQAYKDICEEFKLFHPIHENI